VEHVTQAKKLRNLLENASGQSQHVIAVNLDVRGFSSFCDRNESANVVLFIREIYRKLIDHYFQDAPFIKTTGDGLLVVIPHANENLQETAGDALQACLKAHDAFSSLCADQGMINFSVPRKIGIGLSRGAVSRIVADGGTLDYSGRVLNLASRLMNLARPGGIVFDAEYLTGISSPPELEATFSKTKVWLWGLAERDPIEVYYSKNLGTRIPAMFKKRLDKRKWASERTSISFENLERMLQTKLVLSVELDYEPSDPDEITVRVQYPEDLSLRLGTKGFFLPISSFKCESRGGRPRVVMHPKIVVDRLRTVGFVSSHKCVFEFKYPR